VGGGIGGVICLKYAKDAGLKAVLLEARERIGGLWRDLPAWQDIQFRKEEWTLGELPLAGEDQPNILRNIEAWAESFDLGPHIRLDTPVQQARHEGGAWTVTTPSGEYRARFLIAATGGHNRPVVPPVERLDPALAEFHSSALRDPEVLRGQRVVVVGGGASAYDLLDLSFTRGAAAVAWVYRSTKWMRPTRRTKYFGTDLRLLLKYQVLGLSASSINRLVNRDFDVRYAKAGLEAIKPQGRFDIRRNMIIPGRPNMIRNFPRIERHQGEVRRIHGRTLSLSGGEQLQADVLLWGTGYRTELGYLGLPALSGASLNDLSSRRCRSAFLSIDAPNLFLLAPGVLETNTSTPFAYAHVAKSMMAHIGGQAVFEDPPRGVLANHFDVIRMLAARDRRNYPFLLWYLKYLRLAFLQPRARPMPIP